MDKKKYEIHPSVVGVFPAMDADDFATLKESIRKHGFDPQCPIMRHEGHILDGWSRYTVCLELAIEPIFADLPPETDPLEYVTRENIARRHLTKGQKGASVIELLARTGRLQQIEKDAASNSLANLKTGENPNNSPRGPIGHLGKARERFARIAGLGEGTIGRTYAVYNADKELFAEIKAGKSPNWAYNKLREKQRHAEVVNIAQGRAAIDPANTAASPTVQKPAPTHRRAKEAAEKALMVIHSGISVLQDIDPEHVALASQDSDISTIDSWLKESIETLNTFAKRWKGALDHDKHATRTA